MVNSVVIDVVEYYAKHKDMVAIYEEGKKCGEATPGKSEDTDQDLHTSGYLVPSRGRNEYWEAVEMSQKLEAVRDHKSMKMYEKRRRVLLYGSLHREVKKAVLSSQKQGDGIRKYGRTPIVPMEKALGSYLDS